MYKQIKTITHTNPAEFDRQVNGCLSSGEGWGLSECRLVQTPGAGFDYFYAHLERYEMEEADKCCDNCKHCDTPPTGTPCNECDDASEWEPQDETEGAT